LRPGEQIVARSQPFIRRELILLLVLGVPTLGATFFLAGVQSLVYRLSRFEWILTDRRLIKVGGWLNRSAHSVSLDKINEIAYERSFAERLLFSTGTIFVESAATAGVTSLRRIADDDPFRLVLDTQVELRRRSRPLRLSA
jgi:Bacterial PH domain